jgi:TrmH family RNA methyltransferase
MNNLSKIKAKYIKSLQLKKHRLDEQKFIVEGEKSVLEFVYSKYKVWEIIGTTSFFDNNPSLPNSVEKIEAKEKELSQLGSFQSNNTAIAIIAIPEHQEIKINEHKIVLALDAINDPGNLGTIIRIADWFAIDMILLGRGSVDVYNPKVISATKGSLTRVEVTQCDLLETIEDYKGTVLAADMQGTPIDNFPKLDKGLIIMGNESHGINAELDRFITERVTIPKRGGAESLNVAVSTGIICNALLQ